MTLVEFVGQVKTQLEADGDSNISLSTVTYGSAFSTRVQRYIRQFCREGLVFYQSRATLDLTSAIGSAEINLLNGTVTLSTLAIFEPRTLWVNSRAIPRLSPKEEERAAYGSPVVATGEPSSWSVLREGYIRFDKKVGSAYANSAVSGFKDHVAFTADGDEVEIPMDIEEAAILFCAVPFMRSVVSEEIGLNRLRSYSVSAYESVKQYRARQLARML